MKFKDLGIGSRVRHPKFGEGVVVEIGVSTSTVFFRNDGDKEISHAFDGVEVIAEQKAPDNKLSIDEVRLVLTNVLEKYSDLSGIVPLGSRWKGGRMILAPADSTQVPKEIPIETFFHKIVMLRDRLRVLEQQINSHDVLSDEEKVNLQQYITRIYGSLTTFNVLFASKDYWFVGEGGKS